MRRARTHRGDAGFTLLELLVALVLMGLLAAILTGGLSLVRHGALAGERQAEEGETMIRVDGLLRRQLEHALRLGWGEPLKRSFIFDGAGDRLRFVSVQPNYPVAQGLSLNSFEAVGEARHLLRYSRQEFDASMIEFPPISGASSVVAEIPATFTFAYFQGGQWRDSWANRRAMPALVRLRTTDPGSGRLVWPDIVVRVRADVEAACVTQGSEALCTQTK